MGVDLRYWSKGGQCSCAYQSDSMLWSSSRVFSREVFTKGIAHQLQGVINQVDIELVHGESSISVGYVPS